MTCSPIERARGLNSRQFWDGFGNRRRPVIVSGAASNWPALQKWTPQYLKDQIGDRSIRVTVSQRTGLYELEAPMVDMSFNEAVDRMLTETDTRYYIKRQSFRRAVKELRDDIMIPEILGGREIRELRFWFGPGDNQTPLHYDKNSNMIAQVVGQKEIVLFDSRYLYSLYPKSALRQSLFHNVSRVTDIDNPDLTRFPKFSSVPRLRGVLEPGDLLFIPVYWWHVVRGLGLNISVNFWIQSSAGKAPWRRQQLRHHAAMLSVWTGLTRRIAKPSRAPGHGDFQAAAMD